MTKRCVAGMRDGQRSHAAADRFCDRAHGHIVLVGKEHRQFLSTVARRDPEGALKPCLDDIGDGPQRPVTCKMAVRVVEQLEPVEIDQKKGERLSRRLRV